MVNLLKALNLFNCISEVIAQDAAHWNHRDSLAEHDKKYHGGMFKGGSCLFRQKGDGADILGAKDPGMGSQPDGNTETPQDEYDSVVAKYKGTPIWMKAPNGKPTNLTERQWVQVRTPSFKKWFGDWEKKCEVEAAKSFLLNHEAEVSITGDEFQRDGRKLTDKVPEFFMREYGGYAISPEFGRVELDREGVKSDLGHGMRSEKAAAFAAVHDVIEKGFVYNRAQNWKGRGWDSAVIGAPIKIGKDDYICEVVIQKLPNRQGFYLHEVELKEKVEDAFKTHTKVGAPPISRLIVSKLSDEINRDADKISKVVDENGEPKVVFHGSDAIRTEFKMRGGAMGKGAYFTTAFPEAADYVREKLGEPDLSEDECEGYITECFLNVRDENNISSSSYGYGEYIVLATDPTQIKSATNNSGAFSPDEMSTLDGADTAEKAAEEYLRKVAARG